MGNRQPTLNDLVCVCVNPNKKLNVTNPFLFVNLNSIISIYMYTVTIKRINNKELHIIPFWKSMLNIFLI
jgi:hypothetical protein